MKIQRLVMLIATVAALMVGCEKENGTVSGSNNGGGSNSGGGSYSLSGTSWTDGYGISATFQSNTMWLSKEYGAKKYKYSYQFSAPNLTLHPISNPNFPDLTGIVENDVMYIHNPTITYGSTLIYTLYKE